MVQYEIKVIGRVQGVGFRYYVQKQAQIFQLKGWVRNSADGSVVVMVQGEKVVIDTFIDYLRIGPTMSRVTNIIATPVNFSEPFPDFKIRY
ncbi:MAG TPA: acylphosphatase [Draconibacterium sp.]|nr:acylphosphatase [Draconibacterium sp.]